MSAKRAINEEWFKVCGECGGNMTLEKIVKGTEYWRCETEYLGCGNSETRYSRDKLLRLMRGEHV